MNPLRSLIPLFVAATTWAQSPDLDSLMSNLELHPARDSIRAQLLLDVAIKTRQIDPAKAIPYYEEAFDVADFIGHVKIRGRATHGIGICHGMLGNYPESVAHFQKAIDLGNKHGDLVRVADGYNGLGIVYKRLGDYPQSLEYYSKALAVYDSLGDETGTAGTMDNLGVLYDLMKEPGKSMEYYRRAMDLYAKAGKPMQMLTSRFNIGVLYVGEKRYDDAIEVFTTLKAHYDSVRNVPRSIHCAINLGHVHQMEGRFQEAEAILTTALEQAIHTSMKQEQASIYDNLVQIALGRNNPERALDYALKYKGLAEELGAKRFMATAYSLLARTYEQMHDYRQALEAFKGYKSWRDSVYNEDNARAFKAQQVKVEVLEMNRQLAEQELEVAFLEESVRQERVLKWLLAAVSVLMLAVGVLFYQKFAARKRMNDLLTAKNREISRQKAHIEEMNYQLENRMLRAQINPHFIFNSLSSIQHLITTDDKRSALRYLAKFSHLLRQVLESSITGNTLLKEEVRLLEMYLELEALRFDNGFGWSIDVDEGINGDVVEIPTMILQPLIENAILHGLMPKADDRRLSISFRVEGARMRIVVEDNGIGRQASQELQRHKHKHNPSRGVSVTEQRLNSLRKKNGWEAELVYADLVDADGMPAGTSVIITIPMSEIS